MNAVFNDPTLFRLRRTNFKPLLTPDCIAARDAWCRERSRRLWQGDKDVVYCDLDEAYFHCVTGAMLRVHNDDDTPIRHVRNHLHPAKVMVIVVVCAPNASLGRDGKIGMWRVAEDTVSKRSSFARAKNVIYQKDLTMDTDVYYGLWTQPHGIAAAIRQALPNVKRVVVQHDNASAHVGKGNVSRILDEINEGGVLPRIDIESQPANSPDTNVCDLGLFSSLKTHVRKHRSLEKHRAYTLKSMTPVEVDDDDECDEERDDESSLSPLPELTCGIKRLVKGKHERGSLCAACIETVEDDRNAIKCGARGGWWHVDCLRVKPSAAALSKRDAWWACPQCMQHGCATSGRGRSHAACIVCHTRNGCADCVKNEIDCEHWLQCTARLGFYHANCANVVNDDDNDEDWVCKLCKSMPGPLPVHSVAMPTRWPPDGVPMYKCVPIWHDTADAMFGAIEYAWEHYDSTALTRLYETKPQVLAAIRGASGRNNYKLPHWRNKQ